MENRGEKLRAAASGVRDGVGNRLGDVQRALMLKAVLVAVIGLCVIFWPTTAFNILLRAVALLLIIDGVFGVVSMFRSGEVGGYLLQTITSLVVGAVLLFWPDATFKTLLIVMGAWAVLNGLTLLWSLRELEEDSPQRDAQRTVGLALVIIGGVLIFWPGAGIVTLSWVLGIAALAIAAVLFWLAQRIKGLHARVGD
jgi:uncharacterized membrane protein HdeD (DUF308 family)